MQLKIKNCITGTYPVIIHAPGYSNSRKCGKPKLHYEYCPLWETIIKTWQRAKIESPGHEQTNECTILTWNTGKEKGILEQSLDRLNIPYLVLRKKVGRWNGVHKFYFLKEIIDSITTPYIMGLDDYDVLVLRDPKEAIEKFKIVDCDLLLNAEIRFYSEWEFEHGEKTSGSIREWKKFQEGIVNSPFRYLNSGAWIGKTEFLRAFIKKYIADDAASLSPAPVTPAGGDQDLMHWAYATFYPSVKIDHNCDIFFNISSIPRFKRYIKLNRKFYKIPLGEYFLILAYPTKRLLEWLLDISRPIRHRLNLRKWIKK